MISNRLNLAETIVSNPLKQDIGVASTRWKLLKILSLSLFVNVLD
jgi:hypothetical protein